MCPQRLKVACVCVCAGIASSEGGMCPGCSGTLYGGGLCRCCGLSLPPGSPLGVGLHTGVPNNRQKHKHIEKEVFFSSSGTLTVSLFE